MTTEKSIAPAPINIDVLFFVGCPNFPSSLEMVREVVRELEIAAIVREVEVKSLDDAIRLRMLGSPTLQVDGVDVEPAARGRADFSFGCRLYGAGGPVPKDLVISALLARRG